MKNEKKAFFLLFGFLLIIALPLYLFNTIIDCANRFHPIEKEIATELAKENNVSVVSGNEDERKIKMELIKLCPDEIDCIVMGSSLVAYIDKEMVNSANFLNLAVTNGDYYDMYAQFGLLKLLGKKINKVILLIAPSYFFDDGYVKNNNLHDEFMNYSEYMIEFLRDGDAKLKNNKKLWFSSFISRPYFSIVYFQDCINYLVKHHFKINSERFRIVNDDYGEMYFYPQGNRSYAEWMRKRTEQDVIISSTKDKWESYYKGEISEEFCKDFELLIKYLKENNVEIVFYFSPFSPAFWDLYSPDEYPIIEETQKISKKLADKYNIRITGDYNPNLIGIENSQFYDYVHIKKEYMTNFFKF